MKKIYKLLIAANLVVIMLLFSALSVRADWQPANGVSGNTVKCITKIGSKIYVGTFDGGVFKSGDNGQTWIARNNGISNIPILSIAGVGSTIYAGSSGSGLFKSLDDGMSWVAMNNGLTNNSILSLYVSSTGLEVYAGTEGSGIFKTTDGGANWIPINTGLSNLYIRSIVKKGSDFFVGTGNGIYRSTDGGDNWWLRGLAGNQVNALFVDGANLFAGTAVNGIYWSSTSGSSWVQKYCCGYDVRSFSSDGTAVYATTYGSGIVKTSDNGTTWTPVNNGISNLYIEAIYGFIDGSYHWAIAGSHGGGIFVSSNSGTSWFCKKIVCLTNNDTRALASVSTGYPNLLAGTYSGGTFLTADNGNCWTQVKDGNTPVRAMVTDAGNNVFAGTYGGGVFISTDKGLSWNSFNGSGGNALGNLFVMSLAFNNGILYAGTVGGGIYKCTGGSWSPIGLAGKDIRSITIGNGVIYAGTNGNGVYKLTIGTTNWTQINTGLTNLTVYAMTTLGMFNDIFAGTYGGGIFKLTGGTSWTQVNTGLTNLQVWSFAVDGTKLYAGTDYAGLYMSSDAGAHWYLVNAGIPSVSIFSLCVQGGTIPILFAGTGNGVYSRPISELLTPPLPVAAGPIYGASGICASSGTLVNVPYSVGAIANATDYIWTYSNGWTATTQVPNCIIPFNNTVPSGHLNVKGHNATGDGELSPDFPITISTGVPLQPGTISGTFSICPGQTGVYYSVPVATDATSYTWVLPAGATIDSGANTRYIKVSYAYNTPPGFSNIAVYANNGCGVSPGLIQTVTINGLIGNGTITGSQYICANNFLTGIYKATISGSPSSYVWTVPSWATITSGQGSDSINVAFLTSSASGNISVHGTNGICGGPEIYFPVYVGNIVPGPAGPITGPATVCQGQTGVVYSVATIPNAIWYHWELPGGASIVSSGYNFQTITVNFSNTFGGGTLWVCGSTGCDGNYSELPIASNPLPATPGAITGPTTVTQGQTGVNYWVSPVANVTYHWTVPNGATIMSGANTNSIVVNYANWAVTDTLRVYCSNGCGNGQTTKEKITVNPVMHFQFVGGDASDDTWTIYLRTGTLNGINLVPGDEVAVYAGDVMVGAFQLFQTLSGGYDNVLTAYKTLSNGAPGYTPGNLFSFKVYDLSSNTEYNNVNFTFTPWDASYDGPTQFPANDGEYSFVNITTSTTILNSFTYHLNSGHQFVSSYITPSNPNMLIVLCEILNDNLKRVKATNGSMVKKIGANWTNGIGDWDVKQGYSFYMNAADDFTITGVPIAENTPITCDAGYQMVSYLKSNSMVASTAFASILDPLKLAYVQNTMGQKLWYINGGWVNNMGNAIPGQGYMVKMKPGQTGTLTYPAGKKEVSATKSATAQHFVVEGGDASEPVYTVYISGATINGYTLQQGDEIGVYDGENLVGSLALTQTPTGDNQFENAIPVFSVLVDGDGYTANHPLNFKIWKASDNTEYADVPFNLSNPGGEALMTGLYPEEDGVYSVASLKMTSAGLSNDQLITNTVAIYPNPFSNTIHIEYYLNETANVNVSVYNSVGQEIATLMNRQQAAGKQNLQFDGSKLQQGIYNLKIMVSNGNNKFSEIRKIVLMK